MLSFADKYAGNVHSQFGEDLIIRECLSRLGIEKGLCLEFGGNDGLWLSNTAHLIEQGWAGKFIEADFGLYQQCQARWKQRPDVKCICSRVNGTNINAFVDNSVNLLSADTDGGDYEIFKGLKAKPKIVVIEINSSILPDRDEFSSDGGAGYLPMLKLAIEKGYFLVCHTGNMILVDVKYRELFPEIIGDGLSNSELYFNRSHLREEAA